MTNTMQRIEDKEKILTDSEKLKKYQREIKNADDKKLKEYYHDFLKEELDPSIHYGAYCFVQWIVNNK